MKKTRQTTSDTLSMKRIAGGIWAFVFFVAVLLCIVLRLAWSQGGGIEAEVRGHGTARQLTCRRDAITPWRRWVCETGNIHWDNRQLPDRVVPQQAPYSVLATRDLTGHDTAVTSHLPMGWQTAGGLRSPPPGEILLAPGHPSGSRGWWTAQVFIPPLLAAALVALLAAILIRRSR